MELHHCMDSMYESESEHKRKSDWIVRFFDAILLWCERDHQRHVLGHLDDRLLSDMGCDRATAAHESDKPVWRP